MDDFKSQSVEQPVLDSATRAQLNPTAAAGRLSGLKDFLSANKYYVIAIVCGMAIIAVLAFFAFRKNTAPPKPANIKISIDAPDTAPSGAETVFKVKIDNQDPAALVNMQLEVIYPDQTVFVSSTPDPTNTSGTFFPVPSLTSGQNATLFIKAKLQGNINDDKKLVAKLHYHYSNFNSEFVAQGDKTVRLTASDILLDISGPPNTNNSEVVEYRVHYHNNAEPINSARLEMTYPQGFTFAAANPSPDAGKNIWNLGRFDRDQDGTISIQGSFRSAQPGQSSTFTATLSALDPSGNFFAQAEAKFTTDIAAQPLLITQTVENNSDSNVVNPGDVLTYQLRYQNNATVAARNVIVAITLNSKVLDLSTIRAQGAQVAGNTVTWNASAAPNLETLNPSEGGSLSFSVTVKNPAVKDTSTNLDIVSTVKIKSDEYATFLPGNDVTLKVATLASVRGLVEFVSGSLPPQVGKPSVYRVTLSARNATNNLTNALLTAFIPLAAGSFDSASVTATEQANVEFSPSAGKLTWRIGNLPAHSGDFKPPRAVTFAIRLIPSSREAGTDVTMLKTITFTAKDIFTGQDVNLHADDLTTDSIPDSNGRGLVIP